MADFASQADQIEVRRAILVGSEELSQEFVRLFDAHLFGTQANPSADPINVRVNWESGLGE